MTLAERLERYEEVLSTYDSLPGHTLAREVRVRTKVVLDDLRTHPERFRRTGKTKASRWSVQEAVSPTWPLDYDEGEEALVTLVRQGRRSPEEALLLLVCAVNGAA